MSIFAMIIFDSPRVDSDVMLFLASLDHHLCCGTRECQKETEICIILKNWDINRTEVKLLLYQYFIQFPLRLNIIATLREYRVLSILAIILLMFTIRYSHILFLTLIEHSWNVSFSTLLSIVSFFSFILTRWKKFIIGFTSGPCGRIESTIAPSSLKMLCARAEFWIGSPSWMKRFTEGSAFSSKTLWKFDFYLRGPPYFCFI